MMGFSQSIRPDVIWFAGRMEESLARHDNARGDKGWITNNPEWLLMRLKQEVHELEYAIGEQGLHPRRVIAEAADVANFCMMIADVVAEKAGVAR